MKRCFVLLGFAACLACPAAAEELAVTMEGASYQPTLLMTKVGDVIRFVNDDQVAHEVYSPTNGFGFDLGMQEPGTELELPVSKSGNFEVGCVVHPHMRMVVAVTE